MYRVFEYFTKKNNSTPIFESSSFLGLFILSLSIPLIMLINLFVHFDLKDYLGDVEFESVKYAYGVLIAIIYFLILDLTIKRKLKGENLEKLKEKYRINIWFIFLAPVFCVFVLPIIYGWLNGTLVFNPPQKIGSPHYN